MKQPAIVSALLVMTALSVTSQAGSPPSLSPSVEDSYCRLLHVPSVLSSGFRPKPYLGVSYSLQKRDVDSSGDDRFVIRIDQVMPDSPAAKAGVKVNDLILSYTGKRAVQAGNLTEAFKKAVAGHTAGDRFILELLRGTERISVPATLAAPPVYNGTASDYPDIEACKDPSVLFSALRGAGLVDLFGTVRGGLDHTTRTVLNPGSAVTPQVEFLKPPDLLWMLRHPLSTGSVADNTSQRLTIPLMWPAWRLDDTITAAAGLLPAVLPLPHPPEISFSALVTAMEQANAGVKRALRYLSPAEVSLLREHGYEHREDEVWNRMVTASLKIDREELLKSFLPLIPFFTKENLDILRADVVRRFGNDTRDTLYEADTAFGKVIVGGSGPNVYGHDAALILDLGGDDLYLNNAGGSRPDSPVSLVIDWEGNDRYVSRLPFSQGAGILGGGFLLDLGGDDVFETLDAGQGAGLWGLGLLFHGHGRAAFSARSFSQGTGQMGLGLAVDLGGNTSYQCLLGGQGLGLFGGAGILIDLAGNDQYHLGGLQPDMRDPNGSSISMGQGFGQGIRSERDSLNAPGGIGMLIDIEGNDLYSADYFAQGAAYYHGLGILDDRSGDDRFIAGRYAQGAGIHSAVGVLLDRGGNDSYLASFGVSQGAGHDYGIGLLYDRSGNDNYRGGELVQGAATNGSLGVLVDVSGSDRYGCDKECRAFSNEPDGMGVTVTLETNGRKSNVPTATVGTKVTGK